jgi:hypothetical protein
LELPTKVSLILPKPSEKLISSDQQAGLRESKIKAAKDIILLSMIIQDPSGLFDDFRFYDNLMQDKCQDTQNCHILFVLSYSAMNRL